MASTDSLKALRGPILEDREAALAKGDEKAVAECNRRLRAINCEVQGIENPDMPEKVEEKTPAQKAAATRRANAAKKVLE